MTKQMTPAALDMYRRLGRGPKARALVTAAFGNDGAYVTTTTVRYLDR